MMYDDTMSPNYNYKDMNDYELIKLSQTRNQQAYGQLVERYANRIFSFCKSFTLRNEDAQDITQETFIKAWKKLHLYDNKYKFQTWIFSIARNTVYDQLRKNKSIPFSYFENMDNEINPLDQQKDPTQDIYKILEDSANINRIKQIINELNPIEKTIVILHYEEECTFDEIGTILSKPMNTIKSLHRRAIEKIRHKINE